jgi:LAO/AO transport system kinase
MIALGNDTMRALSNVQGHRTHAASDGHVPAERAGPSDQGAPLGDRWTPPIVKCMATRGDGIAELAIALGRHRSWLEGTAGGMARRRERLAQEVRQGLREALIDAAVEDLGARIDEAAQAIEARSVDPYTATEKLVDAFRRSRVRSP